MSVNLEIVQIVGNLILIPVLTLLWSVNTRLSKLEGNMENLRSDMRHNHDENIARIVGRNNRGA